MPFGFELTLSILTALVLAVFTTRFLLRRAPPHKKIGPWRVDLTPGSERAGMYTRAFIAWNSLFALRAPEAVYFTARHDSDGNRLECQATYSIEGQDPDARWWSLTVYQKNHLIPNSLGRYSFSQTTVARNGEGRWRIHLSPQQQAENWLPTGEPQGNCGLALRLYGPARDTLANLESIRLPQIHRIAPRREASA
ncbi:MAG TPA: DUF1214 domain-containing protein [Bryobacteraceae bacterium]|jgi:hypothetical protein